MIENASEMAILVKNVRNLCVFKELVSTFYFFDRKNETWFKLILRL